jgi:RNA polymerase sigma-70 factor (ECF subfamily)
MSVADDTFAADVREAFDWGRRLEEHGPWLKKVILIRTGEPQAVEEVFQQVSLAALEQRSPLADPRKAAPWLHRLAVIKSARYRRQLGRQRRALAALASRTQPTAAPDLTDLMAWLLREERRQLAREALARLPAGDAEMLLLKYAERWSYRRIAERLGITEKAVDARLVRARRRLRLELAVFGITSET